MHNTVQLISDYWHTLFENIYIINDTHSFPQHLSNLQPLQDDQKDVSYDVELVITKLTSSGNV